MNSLLTIMGTMAACNELHTLLFASSSLGLRHRLRNKSLLETCANNESPKVGQNEEYKMFA